MHDEMQPLEPQEPAIPGAETDHEGAMAKADLYKLAKYSMKLFKDIQDDTQLESWVQAKITKAADYIASVYHYLEYEMKFTEYGHHLDNSDTLSESEKAVLKHKLMEAKKQVANLKKQQADKLKDKKVEEGQEDLKKTGDSYKTHKGGTVTKTSSGVKHERDPESYDDGGDETDTMAKSGKGTKSHAKSQSAAEKKAKAPAQKKSKSGTWGMEGGEKFDNRKKTDEGKGDGNLANNAKPYDKVTRGDVIAGRLGKDEMGGKKKEKKVKEGNDGNLANNAKPYDKVTKGDVVAGRLGKDEMGGKNKKVKEVSEDKCNECGYVMEKCKCDDHMHESKPSAGLSKAKKSAVVKKAKKGGDIGKPGKGFAKVEKAAKKSGAKDPKAVAAAAMWKNIKESFSISMKEGNMTDQQYKDALDKVRRENPQALAAALNSKDPNALNKLVGFKLNPGEKTTPMVSDPEGVPMKKEAQSPFPSRNAAPAAPAADAQMSPEKKDAIAKAKHQMAVMPSRGKEMMDKAMAMPESINESAELDRIKTLVQVLKG